MKKLIALALASTIVALPSAANARDRHHHGDRDGRHHGDWDRHGHHYRNYGYGYGYAYPRYSYRYAYPRSRTVIAISPGYGGYYGGYGGYGGYGYPAYGYGYPSYGYGYPAYGYGYPSRMATAMAIRATVTGTSVMAAAIRRPAPRSADWPAQHSAA